MEIMRFVYKQRHGFAALVNEVEQLAFALLRLRRNGDVLLRGKVIEERHNQRAEMDTVFIYRQRFRDDDIGFASQHLLQAVQGRGFATAHNAGERHKLPLFDGRLERGDDLLVLGRFKVAYVANVVDESIIGVSSEYVFMPSTA